MFMGILLLLLGLLALLSQLGIIPVRSVWSFLWPAVIIALGVNMIFRHNRRKP